MFVSEGVAVDPSVVRLPARRLENGEAVELVRGSLQEQLEVLVDVQQSLRGCADRLRGALGESSNSGNEGKGKAKEGS